MHRAERTDFELLTHEPDLDNANVGSIAVIYADNVCMQTVVWQSVFFCAESRGHHLISLYKKVMHILTS